MEDRQWALRECLEGCRRVVNIGLDNGGYIPSSFVGMALTMTRFVRERVVSFIRYLLFFWPDGFSIRKSRTAIRSSIKVAARSGGRTLMISLPISDRTSQI